MRRLFAATLALLCLCVSCDPYIARRSGEPLRWPALPVRVYNAVPGAHKALQAWGSRYFVTAAKGKAQVVNRYEETICSFRGAVDVMGLHTYTATKAIPYFVSARVEICPRVGKMLLPVLVHELGHVLGLGHSIYSSSIMYPRAHTEQWKPSSRDRRNLERLYNR